MTSVSDFFYFTHTETSDFDKFSDIQVATFELRVFYSLRFLTQILVKLSVSTF